MRRGTDPMWHRELRSGQAKLRGVARLCTPACLNAHGMPLCACAKA